jgi:flavoprotein
MVSYDEHEACMLRHIVQNDRVNLDFSHCEGCRHVRDTCPSDRIKERLDRIIERKLAQPSLSPRVWTELC